MSDIAEKLLKNDEFLKGVAVELATNKQRDEVPYYAISNS